MSSYEMLNEKPFILPLHNNDAININEYNKLYLTHMHYDPYGIVQTIIYIIEGDLFDYNKLILGRNPGLSSIDGYTMKENISGIPKYFAIKEINNDMISHDIIDNELNALSHLIHSAASTYIPKIYAIFDGKHKGTNKRFIVMEWDPQGATLDNYVKLLKNKGEYTEATFNNIKKLLETILNIIHDQGFIHRDIKPGNIYISYNDDYSMKKIYILDFGVAVPINTEQYVAGTPNFTPRKTYRKSITREKHKYTRQNNMNSLLMTLNIIRPDGMSPLYKEPNNNSPGFKPRLNSYSPMGFFGGKRLTGSRRRSKSAKRRRTSRK